MSATSGKARGLAAALALVVLLLGGAGVGAYYFGIFGAKRAPWVDGADAALRAHMRDPGSQHAIGEKIVAITHANGRYRTIDKWSVRKDGASLVLELQVAWTAESKEAQPLQVRGTFQQQGQIKVEVFGENSPGVEKQLVDYFRASVWPFVSSGAGE